MLEENAFRLSQASNLSELVPFIHQQQISVKNQIDLQEISFIFDGTTHVCEALVILVRFADEKWNIQQCVVRLMLIAMSLTGEEVARQLIVSLTTELGIESDLLIAAIRDCASVNNVAIRTLSIVFPKVLDIGYFSHTPDHVGEHMKIPVLEEFLKGWIGLFSRSPKARLAYNSLTGVPVPSYSDARWWLKWEVMNHLLKLFDSVSSFLDKTDLPSSRLKLQEIISGPPKNRKLHMELAITIDAMEPFVKATYNLEGDGP